MQEAFLFDAKRTPIGRGTPQGALYEVKPMDLLATLLGALAAEHDGLPEQAEDLMIGCVTPVDDQGFNLARAALLQAGWPDSTGGLTLNRYVTSGLEAVNLSALKVMAGGGELLLAGGVESQSRVPAGVEGGPLLHDPSLVNRSAYLPKGIAADLLATLEGLTRPELDTYALRSFQRSLAREAWAHRVPIRDRNGLVLLDHDEHLQDAPEAEHLEGLEPAFAALGKDGFDAMALRRYPQLEAVAHVHSLGNAAARADGAALILVGNAASGEALGLRPRARVLGLGNGAVDPTLMLTGAVPAARQALQRAGLKPEQVDLWYCHESFAAVCLHFQRAFAIDADRLNPTGGAIAMGQPLGAAGTILLADLLEEMERQQARIGLAAIAGGGGLGVATLIERLN